jgi:murein DD-endopeptidase MepM/ murein hydrolase activator NlpD
MTRKQLYWTIGITGTLIIGGLIIHNRRKFKHVLLRGKEEAETWIKPVAAKITSKFGYRTDPKTGKPGEFHNGIDLAVPSGTPIRSPMSGVVEAVLSGGAGGNELIIRHINGYKTGYAHLSKQLVRKGDKVKQGDVIALSGNTGKSTGPHLHFTLTDGSGSKRDPKSNIFEFNLVQP